MKLWQSTVYGDQNCEASNVWTLYLGLKREMIYGLIFLERQIPVYMYMYKYLSQTQVYTSLCIMF